MRVQETGDRVGNRFYLAVQMDTATRDDEVADMDAKVEVTIVVPDHLRLDHEVCRRRVDAALAVFEAVLRDDLFVLRDRDGNPFIAGKMRRG